MSQSQNIPILKKSGSTHVGEFKQMAKDALRTQHASHLGGHTQVVAVFDISPSTGWPERRFYSSGLMAALATRVLGLAMQLDDNGIIPIYALNDTVKRMEDLTKANLDTYIATHFKSVSGGTAYSPTIRRLMEDATPGDPILAFLFTDGDIENEREKEATRQALREASRIPMFIQCVPLYGSTLGGHDVRSLSEAQRMRLLEQEFSFLHELDEMQGRLVDNANNFPISLTEISDEELIAGLLAEYRDYPEKAVAAGILQRGPNSTYTWSTNPYAKQQKKGWFK